MAKSKKTKSTPESVEIKKVAGTKIQPAAPKKAAKTESAKKSKAEGGKKKGAELRTVGQAAVETAEIISSEMVYQGPLFRVMHDKLIEPDGKRNARDVIRHNGSVVILALDSSKSKKNPWVVIERQYRHAAGQYLWELPAGKLDPGEEPLTGAKRELAEETGYAAKKWKPLVEYYASPGFLGEAMMVFTAEGLIAGDAHPEQDEHIEFRLVKLSELLKSIDKGLIRDGKTLTSVLLYARQIAGKHKR